MRGSCIILVGMDYDYVIDVVAGSKKPLELDMVQYRPIIL